MAADITVSAIVALAQAGYECCRAVTEYKEHAARIAERYSWIITRIERWQHICDCDENKETAERLQEALKAVNHCMEAASKERKTWRSKVKHFIGSRDLVKAIEQAENNLNNVLHDLNLDRTAEIMDKLGMMDRTMQEILEAFGSAQSSNNPSKTNQEEHDDALKAILEKTSEVFVAKQSSKTVKSDGVSRVEFKPTTKELKALEIKLNKLKYEENDLIGGGGFSDVYSGFYKKTPVAIKCLKIDKRELETMTRKKILRDAKRIAAEALLGYRCSIHPNIVQIYGFHVDLKSGERIMERPMIIMERMHVTLFEVLHYKRKDVCLSYSRRFQFLLDIARAIEFIHLQGIVHHDIKSLNILLNKDLTEAKLADFGEAKVKGLNTTRLQLSTILSTSAGHNNVAGTVAYQAPEILSEEVKETSRVSEMYSFGVTIWECLTNRIPHKGKKEQSITVKALTKKHIPMLKVPRAPAIAEAIESPADNDAWVKLQVVSSKCLSRNRATRPTASEVVRDWNQLKAPISSSISMVPSENKKPAGNTKTADSTVVSTVASMSTSGRATERSEDPVSSNSEDPENCIAASSNGQGERTMCETIKTKRALVVAFACCLVIIIVITVAVVLTSGNPGK